MANETFMSFYLKANRLHVFVDALRGIGSPNYIAFMIEENGETLIMKAYEKKDFYSHRVPPGVYNGCKSMEISSQRLCDIISGLYDRDRNSSYRIPGVILREKGMVLFYLTKAEPIEHDGITDNQM